MKIRCQVINNQEYFIAEKLRICNTSSEAIIRHQHTTEQIGRRVAVQNKSKYKIL